MLMGFLNKRQGIVLAIVKEHINHPLSSTISNLIECTNVIEHYNTTIESNL